MVDLGDTEVAQPHVGAAPAAIVPAARNRYQIPPSPPGQVRLALYLYQTSISVGLFCGANTTLSLLHLHLQSLVPLMLSYILHPYLPYFPCRTAPMHILCLQRPVITLNIGWLRLHSGSVQLFLRLSVATR
ncbi:hypothetical protein QKP42_gp3 [Bat hepatitis E virus]|uniref:Uncharacterized protein n=1 Tax=horseshoe bat hepatitis E virus TaxID=3070190 RepID=A0AAC8RP11_9VIRU|nr:hypothetical protein QKP42_gp3 [Bat hepatitis E virus]AIF74287.1 hypothetical protein [horseshoe bat hepatitis E virus]